MEIRALIDNLPELVWTALPDGNIDFYNRRWYEYTGTTFEEMQGRGWEKVHDPATLPKVVELWKASLATGERFEMEFPIRGADGVFRTFLTRVAPLRDESGTIIRWVGINVDIDERRKLREQLQRERNILRVFIEHAPAAIAMFDRQMRYIGVSRRWLADYKLVGDVTGKCHYDLFPDLPERWREVHRRSLAGEVVSADEDEFPRADGTTQYIRWESRPWHDSDGSVGGVILAADDITQRVLDRRALELTRQEATGAAARFRAAFHLAAVGIAEVGLDGRWLQINDRFCAILGYPRDELLRLTFQKLTYAEDLTADLALMEEALAGKRSSYEMEKRYVRKDGSIVWVLLTSSLVRRADGAPDYFIAAVVDTTEEKRAKHALEQARDQAEEANRTKDEFLAMLGHELRNPLSPITTAVQLLRLKRVETRELDVIERQAQHLSRLVDDLLDVSRITRGKIALHKEACEIADVVTSALETAGPLIESGQHTLISEVPPRGLVVEVDRVRMAQVISNLLTNAAKYTAPRGRIVIEAHRDGADVVVSVHDSGEGIAPELLPHVFDMFVQARQNTARSRGGLGLGLAIVKSLVTQHGGRVSAESAGPGRGSTFSVRIPAVHAAAQPRPSASSPNADRRGRILVVDDNRDNAEMLACALEALGYQTATAFDGRQGLDAAAAFAPSIALLDIGLPVMDGYELAARLRREHGDLTMIAITGYGQPDDRERARAAGFREHLTKPVDLETLSKVLDRIQASPA